nr:unnamed protein product [Callosobruchus analis]
MYAVVSDNASAMVKMGSLLKHCMWHSTCNSHTGNILVKDILEKKLVDNEILVRISSNQICKNGCIEGRTKNQTSCRNALVFVSRIIQEPHRKSASH